MIIQEDTQTARLRFGVKKELINLSAHSANTILSTMDMEHGETFTTHGDYDQVEMIREFNDGEKLFHVGSSSNPDSPRHTMVVEAGSTMLHALDHEGNNLYICFPDM